MFSNLKQTAKAVLNKREAYIANAKPYADKAISYAKDNPSEVMMGIMALLLMDIESDIDDLEEHTAISAADFHDYRTR